MSDMDVVNQDESDMSKNRDDEDALSYASSYESDVGDSDGESGYEDSGCESDGDSGSTGTHGTFASIAKALGFLSEQLAELDGGFECMESSVRGLEKPALAVTVATYSQPAVLEAAPFRHTRFRWRPESLRALECILGSSEGGNAPLERDTVSFTEICAAVRRGMFETGLGGEAFRASIGLPKECMTPLTFLEALNMAMHHWVH